MEGIIYFTNDSYVGKKSEYTKEQFIKEVNDEHSAKTLKIENVIDGYCRYYPNGIEDSEMEFGKGVGIYQFVDRKGKGVFEVWNIRIKEELKDVKCI